MIPYSEQENADFLARVAEMPYRPESELDGDIAANAAASERAAIDALGQTGKGLVTGAYAGVGSGAFLGLEAARGAGIVPSVDAERQADLQFLKSLKPDPKVAGWLGN